MKNTILPMLLVSAATAAFAMSPTADYSAPRKIADYLFEMDYRDYAPNRENPLGAANVKFGCSAVRNGDFYGRNFDFYYNHMAEIVVRMAASTNRFASLAVCAKPGITQAAIEAGLDDATCRILPNTVIDGINEKGVACNVNVVPYQDVAPLTGTNPGKPNLHLASALRVVLDQATSARHALEILGGYNLFGSLGTSYYFFFNDTATTETYTVEFIDNKMVWTDQKIMVNFYHTLPAPTLHGQGLERHAILTKYYDEGSTADGMLTLMKRVHYSQAYKPETQPVWYSEYFGTKGTDGQDLTLASPRENFAASIERCFNLQRNRDRDTPDAKNVWFTNSTSVYDLKNKTLRLVVQEDYDHVYEFML